MGQPLCRTGKSNTDSPQDPAIPLLGTRSIQVTESRDSDTLTPMFRAASFTVAKKWKQPKSPHTEEWINEMR